MVKIQDHYVPADFMILDLGEKEEDAPIILRRLFLNATNAIITSHQDNPLSIPRTGGTMLF
jgi:hypothetical protein